MQSSLLIQCFYRKAEVDFEVGSNLVPLFVKGQAHVLPVVLLRRRRAVPGFLAQSKMHVFDGIQRGVTALGGADMWAGSGHTLVHLYSKGKAEPRAGMKSINNIKMVARVIMRI